MAAQWKNSGEGSSGSPYSSFRFIQDIMYVQTLYSAIFFADGRVLFRGCKGLLSRSGGVTHWLITPDDDGIPMVVCWGQNAANGQCFFLPTLL